MAKKKIEVGKCGDCAHGKPTNEFWDKALDGHYCSVRCPFFKFARVRTELGCVNWKPKS